MTRKNTKSRKPLSLWLKVGVVSAIFFPIGVMAQGKSDNVISQKNRTYAPKTISIASGETLKVVNDDIFIHHAFVDSEALEFDSGSMDEGDTADITFDTPGKYWVKCAIHPKMKLEVTVE